MSRILNVIVAMHNLAARGAVLRLLESDESIHVLRVIRDGREAVALARKLQPDLILLGVRLERLGGLEAVKEIMQECPTPSLIIADDVNLKDSDLSANALKAGAIAVLHPPLNGAKAQRYECEFLETLKGMSKVKLVRRWAVRPAPRAVPRPAAPPVLGEASIVAIGTSTGGPAVLEFILSQLSRDYPVPILIVQHIASGFIEGVASWLDRTSQLKVKLAEHGEKLRAGAVYLAPDDHHLGVGAGSTVVLSRAGPVGGFRPSASYLFESVARAFGRNTVALVLSGMGRDGLDGLHHVYAAGGVVIAQSEDSCVVYGMPRVAIEDGIAHRILSPREIRDALIQLVRAS